MLAAISLSWQGFKRLGKEVILIDVVDTCLAGYYDHDLSDMMR